MVNLKKLREFLRCNVLNVFPSVIQSIGVSPIFANIRLTQRCSSRCQSCAHWLNPETSELTTEQWKNILEALRRAGYIGVSFTGGDIFSRPDWHELLAFSLNQGLNVNFTTNGLLLDEDAAKTLKNLAVSSILISLDDLTENFDEIRGVKDGAQKAMAAIELLKKYRNPATSLGIAVTVMKNNVSAFQEVVQYGLKNNLAIRIYPIHFTHYFFNVNFAIQQYRLSDQERQTLRQTLKQMMGLRASHKELMPKLAHLMWVYDYFQDYRQKNTPCFKPMLNPCIEPNGDIRPCCSMNPVGNLTTQRLEEIIASDAYGQGVVKGLIKECPSCSCHYALSLDANIVYQLKDVLLRLTG